MTGTLFTVGYSGRDPADLAGLLPAGTLVLDVRLSPRSRDPRWQRSRLAAALPALGLAYQHEAGLGNLDFRTGGLLIADPQAALPVARALAAGQAVALLCACASPVGCHREKVAELITAVEPTIRVVHLKPRGVIRHLPSSTD